MGEIETYMIKCIHENNIEKAGDTLNMHLQNAHKITKMKEKHKIDTRKKNIMEEVNEKFINFRQSLEGGTNDEVEEKLNIYTTTRKKLTYEMLKNEHGRWVEAIKKKDSKQLWSMIEWNGNFSRVLTEQPAIHDMKNHFEELYTPEDKSESEGIGKLDSNVYIPLLDDPITERDVNEAMKDCKKGGYDYNVSILNILIINMLPLLTLLFNCLLYISYPLKLACSLLITIPKGENLKLPCNVRGIQMLPAIWMLYDRIITKRLERWVDMHDEQTGFRKGNSTLTQIFTIRIIVETIKKTKGIICIGCFDVEKAFDKVSRLILFKKLINAGIGYVMLSALKSIYVSTSCILDMNGKNAMRNTTRSAVIIDTVYNFYQ